MPQRTNIEWTDYSSNPLKLRLHASGKMVNACVKCSPGCGNCYAESITRRYWPKVEGDFPGYSKQLMRLGEMVLNDTEVRKLLNFKPKGPFKHGDMPRVFIEDMADLFEEHVPDGLIARLFNVFGLREDVIFQVLTKRAERMCDFVSKWVRREGRDPSRVGLPDENIHLGVSVEDQQRADERIPWLLKTPAAVRFLSCEPLLGPVDLTRWLADPGLHWVIIGGESGPGARPCNIDWIRSLVWQCKDAGVKCFVKQFGAVPVMWCGQCGHEIGRGHRSPACGPTHAVLLGESQQIRDRKGGDPSEWPEDLRVREMP